MPSDSDFSQEPSPHLSPRELSVLRELTTGAHDREIARTLSITEAAVQAHIRSLLKKLGVQNREQAVRWGLDRGIPAS